jgi:hypothetical protein
MTQLQINCKGRECEWTTKNEVTFSYSSLHTDLEHEKQYQYTSTVHAQSFDFACTRDRLWPFPLQDLEKLLGFV